MHHKVHICPITGAVADTAQQQEWPVIVDPQVPLSITLPLLGKCPLPPNSIGKTLTEDARQVQTVLAGGRERIGVARIGMAHDA
jgi:hypothetical protein